MKTSYIKDIISLITAENGVKFNYSPEDYDDVMHLAQLKQFKKKLGLPEEYSPGMPLPRAAFEVTNKISMDLRIFKKSKGFNTSPINPESKGNYILPPDFYYPSTISWFISKNGVSYERQIQLLSDLEFQERSASVISKPDEFFPIARIDNKLIVEPKLDVPIHINYIRLPKKPITVVIDNDGFYEIDVDNSVDLEWDMVNINDIIVIMLGDMGINLNSQNVVQYSENLKNKGI